jgi:hypothetical protein
MAETDEEVRITLRLPQKLRDRLISAAEMNSRSMNGEIVERLDYSFERLTEDMQKLLDDASDNEFMAERLKAEMSTKVAKLEEQVAIAEAKAVKMESFMHQARARLGTVREERDELARFVKLATEGAEKDFVGWQKVADLSDREILLRLLLELTRLSSELTIERSREQDDLARLIDDLNTDSEHIEKRYLPGLAEDPDHGSEAISRPQTVMGMVLSRAIERRTELAMRTIIKEMDKKGMIAPGEQMPPRPTKGEWGELRAAPKEFQGEILEALANVEIDRALQIAREASRKKGAA